MDIKVKDKVNQRHVGRNLQRIRVYLGMKQEALASDLGVSQQEISKIEKQAGDRYAVARLGRHGGLCGTHDGQDVGRRVPAHHDCPRIGTVHTLSLIHI